jgi:RNA-directed DNA polymerase
VEAAQQYMTAGYRWVVDLDLEKFFDRVNHDKLMARIAQRISDKCLLKLIWAYLAAGVMENGLVIGSRRAGERVMESVTRFITAKLKLKVNGEKSAVARPWERKFLGFSFTNAGIPKRRIAPKAVDRFKERVRELTRRTRGVSIERMAKQLAAYLRGWIGYFGRCQTPTVLRIPMNCARLANPPNRRMRTRMSGGVAGRSG